MTSAAPGKGRQAAASKGRWYRAARLAWRVLVALGAAALACVDLARHLLLCLVAAAFGWRFGSR